MNSGGQAKRVVLAIFFAFAEAGTKRSNLMMLDEAFKDLDPEGREACFEAVKNLNIPTVLMTTHDQDLQATKKYDQVWDMVMENDISTLYR